MARGAEKEGKEGSKEFSICRRQEGGEEEEETGNACPTVLLPQPSLGQGGNKFFMFRYSHEYFSGSGPF